MRGYLLDVNLLLALAWPSHTQHGRAHLWFDREQEGGWGTCSVTQLAFVRISSHESQDYHVSPQAAAEKLSEIVSLPHHEFWAEPPRGYAHPAFGLTLPNTLTHHLVTDGYLATLAASHGGKLATLDRQLARTFPEFSVLV
jgi:toxin-antitoxin system PIN domain toxin